MLILFRHNRTAQIIIHTANMIAFDWTNMTQAAWISPSLPELPLDSPSLSAKSDAVGSGAKFKTDLLDYLRAYDQKRTVCKSLVENLSKYDFSEIRAALVASVPGKQGIETDCGTSWGWPGLKNVLSNVPVQGDDPEIVVQISSIATLGQTDKWLDKTLFKALRASKNKSTSKPSFKIIFPTADEIRRSLNGYHSGSAIHVKIQTPAQAKQLQYMKPMLCHWAGDGKSQTSKSDLGPDAGRRRAAPHIKTYIRFADASHASIDVSRCSPQIVTKLISTVDASHFFKSI
jgi:tyrosyl-DNA phosphodiesterase-1